MNHLQTMPFIQISVAILRYFAHLSIYDFLVVFVIFLCLFANMSTFYKNNISQGVAYSVDTSKTYYLVTSIGNNGTMVEITN